MPYTKTNRKDYMAQSLFGKPSYLSCTRSETKTISDQLVKIHEDPTLSWTF